jgi:PAS domain S-box-containing protein
MGPLFAEPSEAELQRQTALLDELFESAPEAVVFIDLEARVVRVNREFSTVFGYAAEEAVGRVLYELIVPEDQLESARALFATARSGARTTIDFERRRKDGTRIHVAHRGAPIMLGGKLIGVYAIYRDITKRKLAEAEQARLQMRLLQAEKMEALGRLAGGIAHDFNNILGGILGYGEMLVEQTPAGSPLRRYSQNVLTAVNRARGLVDQILAYSHSQRGKRVAVDLGRTVAETLELVRGSLAEGVDLEVHLPPWPVTVIGDATLLHQVAMNLCTNAIQAMDGSGRLAVTLAATELEAERVVRHGTVAPGPYLRLTVEDSGRGMDEATLGRIFEPFFTTKEVGKGTGLGLSLVYGIVTDAGGAIDVTSTPGSGSAFTVYLPRVDASIEAADQGVSPAPRGHGERVLVVDDEEALLSVTSEVLARLGYRPATFSKSRAALAEFESDPGRFDAVITDEVMPGLTGTELAELLHRRRADIPVVLVSGYIGPLMAERAAAAGVAEILKKPVRSRDIAAALARTLATR